MGGNCHTSGKFEVFFDRGPFDLIGEVYEAVDFSVGVMCCRTFGTGSGEGLPAGDVLECGEFL